MEPYIQARVHMNWRWNITWSGQLLMDWSSLHIAHWDWTSTTRDLPRLRAKGVSPKDPFGNVFEVPHQPEISKGNHHVIAALFDIKSGTKWIGTRGGYG